MVLLIVTLHMVVRGACSEMWLNPGRVVLQVQFLDDDKYGLLIFHAENLDGVIELDNGNLSQTALLNRLQGPYNVRRHLVSCTTRQLVW